MSRGPANGDDELVLDTRGLLCPVPVIELARRIRDVPVGATLLVLADDPAAATDLPAWCALRGQEFVGQGPPGEFRVRRAR